MGKDYWDSLEVSLAESILRDRKLARSAVVNACQDNRSAKVPNLTLALASMAAVLEEEWLSGTVAEQEQLLDVYRTMIGLSADLAYLELADVKREKCSDLLAFWQKTKDKFFVVNEPL